MVGVPHNHVNLKVVFTRHVEDRKNFAQAKNMFPEGFHDGPTVLLKLHGDERLKPDAQVFRGHVGVEALEHTRLSKALHAGQATGGSQPHRRSQLLIGAPSILL